MKPFEFVLIIISVVVGLALTEFAIGVADMIKIHRTAIFYWPHIVLCVYGFISFLNYWGTVYKLRRVTSWTILNIGIMIISGLLYFVTTRIVFPDKEGFDQNYERYFNENIGTILLLQFLFLVNYMLERFLIEKSRKLKNYLAGVVFLAVMLSGVIIDNTDFRGVLMFILLAMQVYYMYSTKVIIQDKDINLMLSDADQKNILQN